MIDLELEIDEVVISGIARSDRSRFASALRRELERLLGEGPVPTLLQRSRDVGQITAQPPRPLQSASAVQLGTAVARTIYEELSR